jgi:hypothetical protein
VKTGQIIVAADDAIGIPTDRQFQKSVVVRITANSN